MKRPNVVRLTGKTLYLTEDKELLRRQLAGASFQVSSRPRSSLAYRTAANADGVPLPDPLPAQGKRGTVRAFTHRTEQFPPWGNGTRKSTSEAG